MVLNFVDVISLVWLGLISFLLFTTINHYRNLTKNTKGDDLQSILENIVKQLDFLTKDTSENTNHLKELEEEGKQHFQKMALVRFNPFKDTGGNQSFVLTLLTKKGDGVILSNLYARTGSRWYIKRIIGGKSQDLELSKEEEEAVKNALKT